MRFKVFTFVIGAFVYTNAMAQTYVAPAPQSVSCLQPYIYTHPSSPGAYSIYRNFANASCVEFNETTAPGNLIKEGITNAFAGESVHLTGTMHVGNFGSAPLVFDPATGNMQPARFHAYIANNDLEVAWFTPEATVGTVGQYEKLELGIKLPTTLATKINNFVTNSTNPDKLNPFDPGQVSFEADFYYLNESFNSYGQPIYKKIYGFYYQEYIQPASGDADWTQDPTDYKVRFRFAPPVLGNWVVKIKIITPTEITQALPVNFVCIPSSNEGFVRSGTANPKYMKLGNQTFIPVGQNLYSPFNVSASPPWLEYENYDNIDVKPVGYYDYRDRLEDLAAAGGNWYRYIIAPPATEIEFEDIGNYSNRMDNAWEMDRILDKSKELGLYIHYNLQLHFPFENASIYNMYYWDWKTNSTDGAPLGSLCHLGKADPGHCYNWQLGLTNPIEFFTDAEALTYYKRRIRYLIARYGYSTNIGLIELFSEIDNAGQGGHFAPSTDCDPNSPGDQPCCQVDIDVQSDYWENSAHGISSTEAISNWQINIAKYIKDSLFHTQHLISTNYTGGSGGSKRPNNLAGFPGPFGVEGPDLYNDDTYYSNYIDVMTYNNYGTSINRFENDKDQIQIRHDEPNALGAIVRTNHKPILFSEQGGSAVDCSNGVEWLRMEWITPFLGCAGVGNPWEYQYDNTLWPYFGMIKNFLNGYNFADEEWAPVYDSRNDDKTEVFALVSENKDEAIGVIINRTVNFVTMNEGVNTYCGKTANANDAGIGTASGLDVALDLNYNDPSTNELKIDLEPGDYAVEYYSGITGGLAGSDLQTVFLGKLNLEHPTLRKPDSPAGFPSYIMPFKAFKTGSRTMSPLHDSTEVTANQGNAFRLVPNPANNSVTLSVEKLYNNQTIQIMNPVGQCVFSTQTVNYENTISTAAFENGTYTVIVTSQNDTMIKKLVIVR